MADYFTHFSLVITLKDPAQQAYALELASQAAESQFGEEPVPEGFPAELADSLEDWHFETEREKDGIWLHSQDGGIEAVCAFIQHLLAKFDPASHVTFEWSHDCSKPRTDAYGGGAAFITAHEIKTMNTGDWINSHLPVSSQPED